MLASTQTCCRYRSPLLSFLPSHLQSCLPPHNPLASLALYMRPRHSLSTFVQKSSGQNFLPFTMARHTAVLGAAAKFQGLPVWREHVIKASATMQGDSGEPLGGSFINFLWRPLEVYLSVSISMARLVFWVQALIPVACSCLTDSSN